MVNTMEQKNCILIVDDDFINRELLKNIFSNRYTFEEALNGREGLEQIERHLEKLCAIILDVQMPELTGIEVLERISARGITQRIPTFLITARDDDDVVSAAYGFGVMDVVSKPVNPIVIQKRVESVIELFSAREDLRATVRGQEEKLSESARAIDELNRTTVEVLATAIEFRDIESGQHVSRIYGMTKYILQSTPFGEGLSAEDIENIARGAIMHDVGKIAISDVILNKPGRLTREEFDIMKQHTAKGAALLEQICKTQFHDSYRYALDIAHHHHERWDGNGYPDGLKGSEISVAAQVVSIADVYDALVSERVYKKALDPDVAVRMICDGQCGVFNPKLLECFVQAEPAIRKWYSEDADQADDTRLQEEIKRVSSVYDGLVNTYGQNAPASSVMDVMLLMTAVKTAYDMIISVNLTQNTFYMIDYDRFLTHCADHDGVFDDLIDAALGSIPVSHRQLFFDTFCRTGLLKAFRDGKKSVSLEHPQYGDDGTLHWVMTKVLFMEDVRTGDVLEITMAQYIDDEHAQREKTQKILADALNLAEQANTAKYDFFSKMSHDIRTPLNAIIGMTTIIAANLDDRDKIADCLMKIGTSSRHLLGIINDVLDYTKLENGSMMLHNEAFDMRELISSVATENAAFTKNRRQSFIVELDDELAEGYVGDAFRIRQVLMSLLDNACRFTPDGGRIELTARLSRRTSDHDVISFTVTDTGTGIRPEFLGRLFEPFAQDGDAGRGTSSGLGLAISRNLAHLMNGDIGVASRWGEGSAFTFELPMERSVRADETFSDENGATPHVLVVDDDRAICEQTAILLNNMGIRARTVDNGLDAVELVRVNLGTPDQFDVAIVDWRMPGIDGVETVRRIRKTVGNSVLVVVMSAYDWTDIEEEARAAGVDLFMAKPITEASLRTAIACTAKVQRNQEEIIFHGEKVLLAEDNEFNAEVAKAILEMRDLRVDVVSDGKQAYEAFVNAAPGEYLAVFLDILMPVMDGHEAARAIRASRHPEASSIPIYAMTANAFHSDILEAKLAGMNGHIAKPVDFDEVARILQSVVKKKQNPKFTIGGGRHEGDSFIVHNS